MIKGLILAFFVLMAPVGSAQAQGIPKEQACMSKLCGEWKSKDNGSFIVTTSVLGWNKHRFYNCRIVAQDPRISIVKCTKVKNKDAQKTNDVTMHFYLKRVNDMTMQVLYSKLLPEKCIADISCWPNGGMFFTRVNRVNDDPDPAQP